jgi:hypothetical protein
LSINIAKLAESNSTVVADESKIHDIGFRVSFAHDSVENEGTVDTVKERVNIQVRVIAKFCVKHLSFIGSVAFKVIW